MLAMHAPIEIVDRVDDQEIAELRDLLYEFNYQATGYRDGRSLSVLPAR